jgi:hypothetical protein
LLGDGVPPNGAAFGHGISFPMDAVIDDFFLRTDFLPNRLFRFNGSLWVKIEDLQRETMTNNNSRQTLKTSFINNDNITGSVEVGYDVYVVNDSLTNAGSVLTTIGFVPGMVATVYFNDVKRLAVVTAGAGGKAFITFKGATSAVNESANIGDTVQWKLFTSSVPERQALSKALKPKADL